MTTDHLAEARRLATDIYYCEDDETLARQKTANAIEHLANAVAEVRAQARLERNPGTVELLQDAEKNLSQAAPMEIVPVLLPEHRDRVWRDKDRELWRWRDEVWQVYTREIGWVAAAEGHRASNYRRFGFGPFTAVEEA